MSSNVSQVSNMLESQHGPYDSVGMGSMAVSSFTIYGTTKENVAGSKIALTAVESQPTEAIQDALDHDQTKCYNVAPRQPKSLSISPDLDDPADLDSEPSLSAQTGGSCQATLSNEQKHSAPASEPATRRETSRGDDEHGRKYHLWTEKSGKSWYNFQAEDPRKLYWESNLLSQMENLMTACAIYGECRPVLQCVLRGKTFKKSKATVFVLLKGDCTSEQIKKIKQRIKKNKILERSEHKFLLEVLPNHKVQSLAISPTEGSPGPAQVEIEICALEGDDVDGALLRIRQATGRYTRAILGGSIFIDGKSFGLTVAHAFLDSDRDSDITAVDESSVDESASDDEMYSNTISNWSSESDSEGDLDSDSENSTSINQERLSDKIKDSESVQTGLSNYHERTKESDDDVRWRFAGRLANLSDEQLDWAAIDLQGTNLKDVNTSESVPDNLSQLVVGIADIPEEAREFFSKIGKNTMVRGRISSTLGSFKLPGKSWTRTYPVIFHNTFIEAGDCGAWVIDADLHQLYGHLIAGIEGTPFGYIAPAQAVFDNIKMKMHAANIGFSNEKMSVGLSNDATKKTDSIISDEVHEKYSALDQVDETALPGPEDILREKYHSFDSYNDSLQFFLLDMHDLAPDEPLHGTYRPHISSLYDVSSKKDVVLITLAIGTDRADVKAFFDVHYRGKVCRTAIMEAALRGHLEVVKLLLSLGADANIQDTERRTALQSASLSLRNDRERQQRNPWIQDLQMLAHSLFLMGTYTQPGKIAEEDCLDWPFRTKKRLLGEVGLEHTLLPVYHSRSANSLPNTTVLFHHQSVRTWLNSQERDATPLYRNLSIISSVSSLCMGESCRLLCDILLNHALQYGGRENCHRTILLACEVLYSSPWDDPRLTQCVNKLASLPMAQIPTGKYLAEMAVLCTRAMNVHGADFGARVECAFLATQALSYLGAKEYAAQVGTQMVCLLNFAGPSYQHRRGSHVATLAVSAALAAHREAASCLHLLEFGRAVVASTLRLDSRPDLTDLLFEHPRLARKFIEVRQELLGLTATRKRIGMKSLSSRRKPWQLPSLAEEFDSILQQIQNQSGFERFLQSESAADLALASQSQTEAIAVINVNIISCGAILIQDGRIRYLPLPKLSDDDIRKINIEPIPEDSEGTSECHSSEFAPLELLWTSIVGPILDDLGFTDLPAEEHGGSGKWPRVWWASTGVLKYIPLHAAGQYSPGIPGRCTMDRVVSSYSPSVRRLIHSRLSAVTASRYRKTTPKFILASTSQNTEDNELSSRLKERFSTWNEVDFEILREPSKATLKQHLSLGSSIFHSEGDRTWNDTSPLESCLFMSESIQEQFTLKDLVDLSLYRNPPWLLYLSTFSAIKNEDKFLLDDAINLMGACHGAGFQHVVGSLWKVPDSQNLVVSEDFYGSLLALGNGELGKTNDVALALHLAIRKLRDTIKLHEGTGYREHEGKEGSPSSQKEGDHRETDKAFPTEGAHSYDEGTGVDAHSSKSVPSASWPSSPRSNPLIWAAYIHVGI